MHRVNDRVTKLQGGRETGGGGGGVGGGGKEEREGVSNNGLG